MALLIACAVLLAILVYMALQGVRCAAAVKASKKRLASYGVKTAHLSYGDMSYVDAGRGPVILSVHGIFGGFDQAYETCKAFQPDCRILAPSRFGYLGSGVRGDGTPAEQARAYVELLDALGVDKAFVLATSAGGSVAIRFALDYPKRTAGLILYSSAMPFPEKPESVMEYVGPPAFLCSDYAMFLLSPLFEPIMGMTPSTIYGMLPISTRKAGVVLDASITNPDMARSFDEYPIETLQCPILILHAKDDKLADFQSVCDARHRFPDGAAFVAFEDGGHLLAGHGEEVKGRVIDFLRENASQGRG